MNFGRRHMGHGRYRTASIPASSARRSLPRHLHRVRGHAVRTWFLCSVVAAFLARNLHRLFGVGVLMTAEEHRLSLPPLRENRTSPSLPSRNTNMTASNISHAPQLLRFENGTRRSDGGTNVTLLGEGEARHYRNRTAHRYLRDDLCAVLVDVRCHLAVTLVLRQAVVHLGPHVRVVVRHSPSAASCLGDRIGFDTILRPALAEGQLSLEEFDPRDHGFRGPKDNKGVRYDGDYWYQRFMTNASFWDSLPAKRVITLQADTLVCRPISRMENETFHNPSANYVGGMSYFTTTFERDEYTGEDLKVLYTLEIDIDQPSREGRTTSHLNGGFSLHDVPWTIECIRQYGGLRRWTEDDLWNYCLNYMEYRGSGPPSSYVTEFQAWSFASDNGLTKCLDDPDYEGGRLCPFGVHKPWQNQERHGNYTELVQSCPGLDRLQQIHAM